jgi:transposase-like protein
MNCPNCKNSSFYTLANGYIKCKKCAKKLSLEKLKKDRLIIEKFCEDKNALETSRELNLNYKTVKDRFDLFRKKIALFSEDVYQNSIKDYSEYEEFFYIKEREKHKRKKSLSQAINIIGFYSNGKVYTLLMPKIQSYNFNTDEEFTRYFNWYKLRSYNAYKTKLNEFWKYIDVKLKKYKGINEDNFFYYLKEQEFKFNYKKHNQIEILKGL